MFTAMRFDGERLHLIDQRALPAREEWLACSTLEDVATAIEDMVVRGAPAIGCAAAFGVALEAARLAPAGKNLAVCRAGIEQGVGRLARTRPTAVNLFFALEKVRQALAAMSDKLPMAEVASALAGVARHLYEDDLATCRSIGEFGAAEAGAGRKKVLTHCNAGGLATAGYGTALGVIRSMHRQGKIDIVYADETRPWFQGARLTAFELKTEGIPYKVIADSVAAWLMQRGGIDWVVVGADRIATNGDTANKIGTYSVAVNCRHHGIPFYIAAPLSTFDFTINTGADIPVEERSPDEVRSVRGQLLTPADAPVYNPSFDVTPAELISGIITEKGVLKPPFRESIGAVRPR